MLKNIYAIYVLKLVISMITNIQYTLLITKSKIQQIAAYLVIRSNQNNLLLISFGTYVQINNSAEKKFQIFFIY